MSMFDSLRILFKRTIGRRDLKIPSITEAQLGISDMRVRTTENKSVNGNVSRRELQVISRLVLKQQPRALFEIGTFDGRTTINMAQYAPQDARVYTLDLPKQAVDKTKFPLYKKGFSSDLRYINKEKIGARWEGKEGREKITQLYGDSATFDYSPFFNQIDFIFIDGSHAKDYVRNDTEAAFKLLREHGTIIWHDYGMWEDVSDVLDHYFEEDSRFKNARHIKGTCFVVLTF